MKEDLKQKTAERLRKEIKLRLANNQDIFEKNEKKLPEIENLLDIGKKTKKLEEEMYAAKMSAMKVLNPTYEYEQSETWNKLLKRKAELDMRAQLATWERHISQLQETKNTFDDQQVRIHKEKEEYEEKLALLEEGEYDFSDEELEETMKELGETEEKEGQSKSSSMGFVQ